MGAEPLHPEPAVAVNVKRSVDLPDPRLSWFLCLRLLPVHSAGARLNLAVAIHLPPLYRLPPADQVGLINIIRKSRDFSHGMDRPLLSPFMGLFVCFCIFLVIDIFLDNFFAHIAQCTHIVTRRPKMTAPILATSYFWMIL